MVETLKKDALEQFGQVENLLMLIAQTQVVLEVVSHGGQVAANGMTESAFLRIQVIAFSYPSTNDVYL